LTTKGHIRRVFPGNNTSRGFYSFYDQIIPPDARRIMVIKGGPGVGKSTFMRRIGEELVERGFDAEFHHCSSDNSSLDGVACRDIGVALIDGTAPHVMDPKNPGAVDEIIHLGDFWNEDGMRAHKGEILRLNREVGALFERAYRYLRAAQAVYEDWEMADHEAMDYGLANVRAAALIDEVFGDRPVSSRCGHSRHLFASAITPDGMVNYLDTIIGPMTRRFLIQGTAGTGKSTLLRKVAEAGVERGLFVEMFHCALNPAKVEHVVIPGLGVALAKSIEPHTYTAQPGDRTIDMNECLDPAATRRHAAVVAAAEDMFWRLFDQATAYIGRAKQAHDEMEKYYVPNMDFEAIEKLRRHTLQRILGYAAEAGQVAG